MRDVLFDHGRAARIGLPEAVFCEGKPAGTVQALLTEFAAPDVQPVLFTRLSETVFDGAPAEIAERYDYHPLSRTAWRATLPERKGRVAVVSAGTADGHATWEAARTLTYLGIEAEVFEDCGVAGLWRLTDRLADINKADVVIVVAGLDAALASVLGALTPKPVLAVPTSVGYGAAQGGMAAIQSMLVSCAPGVAVLNIDNGYGAACAAARILGPA
ncbi:MAG: nickel pincer cofactor biosynthesis protein LarB [Minwuia sp.]|uniref:nickel pincer cofactor biosynthesis protein LarB n=1 Tax=Minwuia sp. TaxID=2493630 RepID=UPI003A881CDF